jgi:dephospho-CoA kinase
MLIAICGADGSGKTYAAQVLARMGAFTVSCSDLPNKLFKATFKQSETYTKYDKRPFLRAIGNCLEEESPGYLVEHCLETITKKFGEPSIPGQMIVIESVRRQTELLKIEHLAANKAITTLIIKIRNERAETEMESRVGADSPLLGWKSWVQGHANVIEIVRDEETYLAKTEFPFQLIRRIGEVCFPR